MIDPFELVAALVAMLRDIPEIVCELDGDSGRIRAYRDQYPKQSSLSLSISEMPVPSVLVAWQGGGPGMLDGAQVWKHRLAVYQRPRAVMDDDPPSATRLWHLFVNGVPASTGQKLLYSTVHPDCYPMDLPSCDRARDEQGLDYFVVNVSFTEIGDN